MMRVRIRDIVDRFIDTYVFLRDAQIDRDGLPVSVRVPERESRNIYNDRHATFRKPFETRMIFDESGEALLNSFSFDSDELPEPLVEARIKVSDDIPEGSIVDFDMKSPVSFGESDSETLIVTSVLVKSAGGIHDKRITLTPYRGRVY